jgi:hypothetical protein
MKPPIEISEQMLREALDRANRSGKGCFACGELELSSVGVFIPDAEWLATYAEGRHELFTYGLCESCAARSGEIDDFVRAKITLQQTGVPN